MIIFPIIILAVVFLLIAIRQVGNIKLQIWQIMLAGALAVIFAGSISPKDALLAINLDVLLFLFGMFVIGQSMEDSGYLGHLSYKLFSKAKSIDLVVLLILFGMGIASALLMNDTLAIVGTPIVILLARKHKISQKLLLLALCFAVTIGSVMSPIGNPQNLLIAINGNFDNPFLSFFTHLALPTLINLAIAYFLLKIYYPREFHNAKLDHSESPIKDKALSSLSRLSLMLVLILIAVKIVLVAIFPGIEFRLTYIALISAAPILIYRIYCFLTGKEFHIMTRIDWYTLIFFIAMFVLMQSVWDSGFFQNILEKIEFNVNSIPAIFGISILLSQLISNVPLVALYLPLLNHAGASSNTMLALAAGSTIAGNLLILGAASNIIIIQNAEKRTGHGLSFLEFARIGVPLTIINAFVYFLFIAI